MDQTRTSNSQKNKACYTSHFTMVRVESIAPPPNQASQNSTRARGAAQKAPLSAEELLEVDSFWEKENLFSSETWLLVASPCSCSYIYVHTDSTT